MIPKNRLISGMIDTEGKFLTAHVRTRTPQTPHLHSATLRKRQKVTGWLAIHQCTPSPQCERNEATQLRRPRARHGQTIIEPSWRATRSNPGSLPTGTYIDPPRWPTLDCRSTPLTASRVGLRPPRHDEAKTPSLRAERSNPGTPNAITAPNPAPAADSGLPRRLSPPRNDETKNPVIASGAKQSRQPT